MLLLGLTFGGQGPAGVHAWMRARLLAPCHACRNCLPGHLLAASRPGAGDKEYQATKGDMKKRDHARAAIAKPLLKQGGKGCQLRIKASQHGTWAPSASPW